jgi:hypothetical protein
LVIDTLDPERKITMLQIGIFSGYFPYPLEEQAKKIKALGFNTIQLDLARRRMPCRG